MMRELQNLRGEGREERDRQHMHTHLLPMRPFGLEGGDALDGALMSGHELRHGKVRIVLNNPNDAVGTAESQRGTAHDGGIRPFTPDTGNGLSS